MAASSTTLSLSTIIVFTREPIPGVTKTRLISRLGAEAAASLAHSFILDALAKARALTDALIIAGSAPEGVRHSSYFRRLARSFGATLIDQEGGPLGARMRRALEPYCEEGALLIGTDTPSLPPDILARDIRLLKTYSVVLGPSLDGGYYAVGVRGALPDIFRGVRWGRASVLASTVTRLKKSRTPYVLGEGWYDIDRWTDLLALAVELRFKAAAHCPCPATRCLLRRLGLLSDRR